MNLIVPQVHRLPVLWVSQLKKHGRNPSIGQAVPLPGRTAVGQRLGFSHERSLRAVRFSWWARASSWQIVSLKLMSAPVGCRAPQHATRPVTRSVGGVERRGRDFSRPKSDESDRQGDASKKI